MSRGRPTKYPRSKKKQQEMFDDIISWMEKGYSKDSVAGLLNICRDTLYRWIDKYPDFSDTIKNGQEKSRQFWERAAIENLTHYKDGKQLNSAVWIFNMRNRFGWRDKPADEIEQRDNNINLNINIVGPDDDEDE